MCVCLLKNDVFQYSQLTNVQVFKNVSIEDCWDKEICERVKGNGKIDWKDSGPSFASSEDVSRRCFREVRGTNLSMLL